MRELWKKMRVSGFANGVLCVALGCAMLFWAGMTAMLLTTVFGVLLIVIGLAMLIPVIGSKEKAAGNSASYTIAAFGILIMIAGIWVLTHNARFQGLIPRLIGIAMFLSGASNLLRAFTLKGEGDSRWTLSAILSAVAILLGIVFVVRSQEVTQTAIRILGGCLLYNGVSNVLITGRVLHYEKMNGSSKEVIDVEAKEID